MNPIQSFIFTVRVIVASIVDSISEFCGDYFVDRAYAGKISTTDERNMHFMATLPIHEMFLTEEGDVVEPVVEEQQETAIVDDAENANQGDETPIEENENSEQQENTETETIDKSEVGYVEDILGGGTQQKENTETEQQNQAEE